MFWFSLGAFVGKMKNFSFFNFCIKDPEFSNFNFTIQSILSVVFGSMYRYAKKFYPFLELSLQMFFLHLEAYYYCSSLALLVSYFWVW